MIQVDFIKDIKNAIHAVSGEIHNLVTEIDDHTAGTTEIFTAKYAGDPHSQLTKLAELITTRDRLYARLITIKHRTADKEDIEWFNELNAQVIYSKVPEPAVSEGKMKLLRKLCLDYITWLGRK